MERTTQQNDRYADLYLNFEDRQQWLMDTLTAMSMREYFDFVDYCFEKLDLAAEAKDGAEFRRVRGLLLALARKELEIGHFLDGASDEQRAASIKTANSYFELAKGFYSDVEKTAVDAAWAGSLEHATKFGYSSGPMFEILTPHAVFVGSDRETW